MIQGFRNRFAPSWRREDPAWPAVFMVLLTGLYLLVEAPFAAYLVDLVGSQASKDNVDAAEKAGRLISGAALAIFVCSHLLKAAGKKRLSAIQGISSTIIPCLIVIAGVYFAERTLVDSIADNSSVALRARALDAEMTRKALFDGGAGIIGISPNAEDRQTPSWKAFVGLFPFLAHADDGVLDRAEAGKARMVHEGAIDTFPTTTAYRHDVFDVALTNIQKTFDGYREASTKLSNAFANAQETASKDYDNDFLLKVADGHYLVGARVPVDRVDRWRMIVKRKSNIDLPPGWNPWDKLTFVRADMAERKRRLDIEYKKAIDAQLGPDAWVPPGIASFDSFVLQPAVQTVLRNALGLPSGHDALTRSMDENAFLRSVYQPLEAQHESKLANLLRRPLVLDDSASLETLGRDAVRSMVVPVLALAFSLLGLVFHMIKFTYYSVEVVARALESRNPIARKIVDLKKPRWLVIVAMVFGIAVAVHTPAVAITESSLYNSITAPLEQAYGRQTVQAATIVIEMERQAHPIGRALEMVGPFKVVRSIIEQPAAHPEKSAIASTELARPKS